LKRFTLLLLILPFLSFVLAQQFPHIESGVYLTDQIGVPGPHFFMRETVYLNATFVVRLVDKPSDYSVNFTWCYPDGRIIKEERKPLEKVKDIEYAATSIVYVDDSWYGSRPFPAVPDYYCVKTEPDQIPGRPVICGPNVKFTLVELPRKNWKWVYETFPETHDFSVIRFVRGEDYNNALLMLSGDGWELRAVTDCFPKNINYHKQQCLDIFITQRFLEEMGEDVHTIVEETHDLASEFLVNSALLQFETFSPLYVFAINPWLVYDQMYYEIDKRIPIPLSYIKILSALSEGDWEAVKAIITSSSKKSKLDSFIKELDKEFTDEDKQEIRRFALLQSVYFSELFKYTYQQGEYLDKIRRYRVGLIDDYFEAAMNATEILASSLQVQSQLAEKLEKSQEVSSWTNLSLLSEDLLKASEQSLQTKQQLQEEYNQLLALSEQDYNRMMAYLTGEYPVSETWAFVVLVVIFVVVFSIEGVEV